jgi:MoxR-like ATPase
MAISELPDDSRMLYAKVGFNVIATANTRDRGVNEMSAALKRRFNFETVQPIPELKDEMALVQRETTKMFETASIPLTLPADIVEILTTTFWELRAAKTVDGQTLETMSTVMSTAEAISTGYAAGLHAYYYDDATVRPDHIVNGLLGSAIKDAPDDLKKLNHYFNHAVKDRKGDTWRSYFEARKHLL